MISPAMKITSGHPVILYRQEESILFTVELFTSAAAITNSKEFVY